ncbi:hypothetical protein AMTRI_Chr10g230700 [Amborella trichopoda]
MKSAVSLSLSNLLPQPHRKALLCALYALLPLALLLRFSLSPPTNQFRHRFPNPKIHLPRSHKPISPYPIKEDSEIHLPAIQKPVSPDPIKEDAKIAISSVQIPISPHPTKEAETPSCDIFDGKWVADPSPPLYNGTTCSTIKENQNCMANGRPDTGYLHWKWLPSDGCSLPKFNPSGFLSLFQNKNLAFVGDSMSRNQLESLLCLLSSFSPSPQLLYSDTEKKFRRWRFNSHNLTVSVYWSPFLVHGDEKSSAFNYNKLYLHKVDEKWLKELDQMDMVVISAGHWFLHPALYTERDELLGCHYCPDLNLTEVGFYGVYRKALMAALKGIAERESFKGLTVLRTFSPAHFEGEWDKAGACPKKAPFEERERALEGMDKEMREIQVEEAESVKKKWPEFGKRLLVLDVTKLALMRPDGHPGPYMNPFPFINGGEKRERVQNDCVHWCLPGPVDTWNRLLLEMVTRYQKSRKPHYPANVP